MPMHILSERDKMTPIRLLGLMPDWGDEGLFQQIWGEQLGSHFWRKFTIERSRNVNNSDDSQAKTNALLTPHKQRIIDQFVGYLNAETEVPVLPKWGPTLWKHAMAEKHITKLQTHGDCVGAWRINKPAETDWTEFVQNLLQQKIISILDIQEGKPIHETRIIHQNGLLPDTNPNAQPHLLPAPAAD